jgi:hypothetical protein
VANEVALCLLGDDYTFFMVTRSNGKHSGNWRNLKMCLTKVFIDGHKMSAGYYGDRLDNSKQVVLAELLEWRDE